MCALWLEIEVGEEEEQCSPSRSLAVQLSSTPLPPLSAFAPAQSFGWAGMIHGEWLVRASFVLENASIPRLRLAMRDEGEQTERGLFPYRPLSLWRQAAPTIEQGGNIKEASGRRGGIPPN